LKELIDLINELAKSLFTGKLTINFHKGNVGKVQVTKTIKSSDLKNK
jgi:hypothetical protein